MQSDRQFPATFGPHACLGYTGGPKIFMIRPILKYGDSVLHEKARNVDAFTPEIDHLIDDMI